MRTCRSDAQAGFTLVELLVVLAILGLFSAGAAQVLFRSDPGFDLRAVSADIEAELRTARSDAQLRNRAAAVTFDTARARYRSNDAWISVPDQINLRVVIAGREQIDEDTGAIRFYPDGSATGGTVHLSDAVETRTVSVDWLTGRVAIENATP